MNEQDSVSSKNLQQKWVSRRSLIRGAAGAAAGAGFVLGSGLWMPAGADDDEDDGHKETCGLAITCHYQKLSWLVISEVSRAQRRDVPDQSSRGRASFHEKLNFA